MKEWKLFYRDVTEASPRPVSNISMSGGVTLICLFLIRFLPAEHKSWFHRVPLVSAISFRIKYPVRPAASSKTGCSLLNCDLLFLLSHHLELQNLPYYQKNKMEIQFTSDSEFKLAAEGKKKDPWWANSALRGNRLAGLTSISVDTLTSLTHTNFSPPVWLLLTLEHGLLSDADGWL